MGWFDRPAANKSRSLLEAIACSIFPVFAIFWSQPLVIFGILGMPSTWLDIIMKDLDLGGMVNEEEAMFCVWRNFFKLALPVFSNDTSSLLHKHFPIIAKCLTSNDEASVFLDIRQHPEYPETFVYVNGIWSTDRMATRAGRALGDVLKREVTVVHNPTNSALIDLGKCMVGKLWVAKEWWVPTAPAKLAFRQVLAALQDENKTKVVLIAHSHGTIIASEVLFRLWEAVDNGILHQATMQKLEMFNLANASHWMHQRSGIPYIENICNQRDNVGMLGANAPAHVKNTWNIDVAGKMIYPATQRWGHMFQTHYLKHLKRGDYPGSKLHDYMKADSEQPPGQSSSTTQEETRSISTGHDNPLVVHGSLRWA